MDESEPIGDQRMRGDGLVPAGDIESVLVECDRTVSLCCFDFDPHHWTDTEAETLVCLGRPPRQHRRHVESKSRRPMSLLDQKQFY